jgi:hypothetical protein
MVSVHGHLVLLFWACGGIVHHCYSSGGRDQDDRASMPAWANTEQDPISKNTQHI